MVALSGLRYNLEGIHNTQTLQAMQIIMAIRSTLCSPQFVA